MEDLVVDNDAAVLVRLLRSSEPGRGGEVVVRTLLLRGDAVLVEERFGQGRGANHHPDEAGVELLTQGVQHDADDLVAQARSHLAGGHPGDRSRDVVLHRQHPVLTDAVHGVDIVALRATDADAVGRTVRDVHERGDLNVVGLDPLRDELGRDGDGLHRWRTTQPDRGGTLVLNDGLVEVGHDLLALVRAVPRRGDVDEAGLVERERVDLLTDDLRLVQLAEVAVVLRGVLLAPLIELGSVEARLIHFGVAEHLKGDLRLLAEPNQLADLKEAVRQGVLHRPAEVHEEHNAVVLAVLLDDLGKEDIVVGAVLVEAVKVQLARLLGPLLADRVRRLATLKLHDELPNEGVRVLDELAVARQIGAGVHGLLLVLRKDVIRGDDGGVDILQHRDDNRGRVNPRAGLLTVAGNVRLHDPVLHGFRAALVGLTLLLLNLLAGSLHLRGLVDDLGEGDALLESLATIDRIHDGLLVLVHRNGDETGNAPLEVDVHLVDDVRIGQVHLGDAEHIQVVDLLVAQEEVAARSGELVLHLLLNADILNDIGDALEQLNIEPLRFGLIEQHLRLLVGSPQGVADLMGDEHGLHRFGNLPDGHDEVAVLNIERRGGGVGIEGEGNVLGGEGAGEDGERSVHALIVAGL